MTAINVAEAPRSEITIAGLQFTVPAPFQEGHVLRPNEAAVLNQTYAENVRNNFASAVKAAKEAEAKGEAPVDVSVLQAKLEDYVNSYDFGIRTSGPRTVVDPVTREALNIARGKVREALKTKGIKVADVSKEKIDELARGVVEKYPQIREQAQRIVEAKKDAGLAELEIDA